VVNPPATPGDYFDRIYAADPDPWQLRERWYERRKRALLLAALPAERYRRAFEPGCATGALTEQLAGRCDQVLAVERSPVAVAEAGRRLAGLDGVRVEQRVVPDWWPDGGFDLVVLAELGYYLDDDGLGRLFDRARSSLTAGGTLAAVHWRHPAPDHARSGDSVHDALTGFAGRSGLSPVSATWEIDFRLDVFVDGPPWSVARATDVPAAS
jgi:trans-aconitate methyltransferase